VALLRRPRHDPSRVLRWAASAAVGDRSNHQSQRRLQRRRVESEGLNCGLAWRDLRVRVCGRSPSVTQSRHALGRASAARSSLPCPFDVRPGYEYCSAKTPPKPSPTAMQAVAEVQDTPKMSTTSFCGVVCTDQPRPFQRSATTPPSVQSGQLCRQSIRPLRRLAPSCTTRHGIPCRLVP
jgi:hypothetical protein